MIFIQLTQFSESIEMRQLVATALRAVFLTGQTGHRAVATAFVYQHFQAAIWARTLRSS